MSDNASEREMNSTEGQDPFEKQIASLKPRSTQLDRDNLMFLAGQASVAGPVAPSRTTRPWWTSAISLAAAMIGFAVGAQWPHRLAQPQVATATRPTTPSAEPLTESKSPVAAVAKSAVQTTRIQNDAPTFGWPRRDSIDLSRVASLRRPATLLALNQQLQQPWIDDGPLPQQPAAELSPPRTYGELQREWIEQTERNRI